jgi:hypothetical protein
MENLNFDDFLADTNAQAAREAEMQAYAHKLDEKLEQGLVQYNYPLIASMDPTIRDALQDQAAHEYEEMLRDHFAQSGEPLDPEALEQSARTFATEQLVRDNAILTNIKMTIAIYDFEFKNGSIPDKDTTDSNKKRLTAEIMTEEGLTADDNLIHFINEVVPGEPLDTASSDDAPYLLEALEKHANAVEQKKKIHELTTAVSEILEKAGELSSERFAVVTKLTMTAMLHAHKGEKAGAMRQAEYDEIIRDNNLPANLAAELLALIERYHPLS